MKKEELHITPPKWPLKVLRRLLKKEYLEEIEGDMEEIFQDNLECYDSRKAKRIYAWDVLKLMRPILIKNLEERYQTTQFGMIKNYLKVAFRILKKEKSFAFINIMGLALAITCSLFIYLWVQDELSYNQHLTDGDRICYVYGNDVVNTGDTVTYHATTYMLKDFMPEQYPEIEQACMISWGNWMAFEHGETLVERNGKDATLEIFEMFEFQFIQGGYEPMKENKMTIAVSESFANLFYGDRWKEENIIGSFIKNEWGESFELTGIYKDLPDHFTMEAEFVIPFQYTMDKNDWIEDWGNSGNMLYVKLTNGVTRDRANAAVLNAINEGRNKPDDPWDRSMYLHPITKNYLYNRFENGKPSGGRIEYVRLLSIAAILILLLASINFMNMSTARTSKRAKETGVRKVLGAIGMDLKGQFFTESVLITFIAMLVSLCLVTFLLPQFNSITDKEVTYEFFTSQFVLSLVGFVLALGIFSGFYPAFYLSSLKTVVSLKGGHKHGKYDVVFRKGLVVFQFMITIVMITGALTVYRQVHFIQSKNIGIDRYDLIRSWTHEMNPEEDYQVFKNELLNRPGIESVTVLSQDPFSVGNSTSNPKWEGKLEERNYDFYILDGNPDMIPTLKIELVDGRNFSWDRALDTANVIINRKAQELMGLSDPVGMDLEMWGRKGKIIGVVSDFNNASLYQNLNPLILRFDHSRIHRIMTRIKPGDTEAALTSIEEVYHIFNPKREFNFDFLDKVYQDNYKSDLMVKDLSFYFTVLAIIISCLGLFALVSYTAEQRTKEIGIRKVLGASLLNILQLLSKEFVLLLVISMFVAVPLAYYVMQGWLEGFAYRIELSWWLFAVAGLVTVMISYSIIGTHALRSALANPVDSLRDE